MTFITKLIDKKKEDAVTEALTDAGINFSKEIGCDAKDVQIRIQFNEKGEPYGQLFHVGEENGRKMWIKRRSINIKEII